MRDKRATRCVHTALRLIALVLGTVLGLLPAGARAQTGPMSVSAVPSRTQAQPGDQVAIAVLLDLEPGWHVHTNAPKVPKSWGDLPVFPTTINADPVDGASMGPPQWPTPAELSLDLAFTGKPERYAVYSDTSVAYLPLVVSASATPGPRTVTVHVSFQACNDKTCLQNAVLDAQASFTVVAPGAASAPPNQPDLFKDLDQSIFARVGQAAAPSAKPVVFNFFGRSFNVESTSAAQSLAILLLAAVGGFLLNLTPCVLPVIPIKIMGLSAAAGNRRRLLLLGTSTSLGTIAFWLGLGAAVAWIASFKAINQLFQFPWFGIGVGLFIAVMGLGMMGLFTVRLPQAVYNVDADRGSIPGSFLFGIMTAVLSTPCTAPFMGAASAWAATQPAARTLTVFASIGVGMALPYFALSAFPAMIERVPRAGPAGELVKQVMGLLLMAVAVFFLGTGLDPLVRTPVDPPIRWFWWIIAAIVCAAMAWLVVRTFRLTQSASRRAVFAFASALLAGTMVMVAARVTDRGPIAWVAYTPERLAAARGAGKVVVLDFTAEWCLNCKALEAGVLHQRDVVKLLDSSSVVPMRVDLTGNNRDGQALLKEMDWVGIPLLAVLGPGIGQPLKFDTYTPQTVRDAVSRARGEAGAQAAGQSDAGGSGGGTRTEPGDGR